MKMKNKFKPAVIGIALLILSSVALPKLSFCDDIVFPWRAMKKIVKTGESFPILYENITASEINGVILMGPYNELNLVIDSVSRGSFEYDSYTHNAVK